MKTLFLNIVLCAIICSISYGQNPTHKNQSPQPIHFNSNTTSNFTDTEFAKLEEVYGSALKTEILNRPSRVLAVKEILRNRVVIKAFSSPENRKAYPMLSQVPMFKTFVPDIRRDAFFDPLSFNPLKYNFKFHSPKAQGFRVGNTKYCILIKPQHYNN
tara:strand:- start:2172 stop:2645 length:474 start_codon:yes stop_codon:yes gene_type:complete